MERRPDTLLICCGALAKEVVSLIEQNDWDHMKIQCLPANLHNKPDAIPEAVRAKIREARDDFDTILVLYADCGTGGGLARVVEEEGVIGVGGAHCYEVYTGSAGFGEIMADEPGCFFVTDFLARHFESLVFKGLGLDRFPQLRETYFRSYRKLVYLAQTNNPDIEARARAAAESIGLEFEMRFTGYGGYRDFLAAH